MSKFGFILYKLQTKYILSRKISLHKNIYVKCDRLNYANNTSIFHIFSAAIKLIYYIYFDQRLKKNTNNYRNTNEIDIKETNLCILLYSSINLFGFFFCNVNKCTSLNTFIWFNLSG